MSNTFIAVEGQHDLEFVCGLLEPEGFPIDLRAAAC
jgi:hypothetical protein